MCLDIVRTPKKLKADGIGYKMFRKNRSGNLYFRHSVGKRVPLPTEKWINEKDYRNHWHKHEETIIAYGHVPYPIGFHIYRNKKLSTGFVYVDCVLISVKFRKACAKGIQGGINTIVAKEIFIQSEVKHG